MKVFCVHCGTGQDVAEPAPAMVTCLACGQAFATGKPVVAPPPLPGAPRIVRPPKKQMGCLVIGLIILACSIPVVGILAAIAIPNFIKFQSRSKQSECKANLKSAFIAEKNYFQEKDAYSEALLDVGFTPERANRYAYFFSTRGTLQDRTKATLEMRAEDTGIDVDLMKYPAMRSLKAADVQGLVELGVAGECPKCSVTIACAGNIDNDASLDIWSISSDARTATDGRVIPAGEPFQHFDDVSQ